MNILECVDCLIQENIITKTLGAAADFFKPQILKGVTNLDELIKSGAGAHTGKLADLLDDATHNHAISSLFDPTNPNAKHQFLSNLYNGINNNRGKFQKAGNKINFKEIKDHFDSTLSNSSFANDNNKNTAKEVAARFFRSDAGNLYHDHKVLANVAGGTAVTGLGVGGTAVLMPKPEPTAFLTTDPTQPINIPIDTHSSSLTNPLLVGALGAGAAYGAYKYIKNKHDNQRMHE